MKIALVVYLIGVIALTIRAGYKSKRVLFPPRYWYVGVLIWPLDVAIGLIIAVIVLPLVSLYGIGRRLAKKGGEK